jgi:hypothetical protein
MATTSRRTGEKGQRTPRSTDAYREKGGIRGEAYCACGALFRNKRWCRDESGSELHECLELVCPACRRIVDQNPAGIVVLGGKFYAAHTDEIYNLVNNTALEAVAKNPLSRVMDIGMEKDAVTITTTDAKLAQKIGRQVFKSHGGELHYVWSHAESPVRVTWSR